MSDPAPIEFEPIERATHRRRVALAALGLLFWIAAIAILMVILGGDQSGAALVITLGSFIIAIPVLAVSAARYRRRLR